MSTDDNRWGCPDWRDRCTYPKHHRELSDDEWRWQFLRRCTWYRKVWDALPYTSIFDEENDPCLSKGLYGEGGLPFATAYRVHQYTNMQLMFNPSSKLLPRTDPFNRLRGGELLHFPSREYLEDEDMMERLDEKSGQEYRERRFQFLLGLLDDLDITDHRRKASMGGTDLAFFQFDLNRPIQPQLERVSTKVKDLARIKRTPRMGGQDREHWHLYLRLIDADDQGAQPMEIYQQFLVDIEASGGNWEEWEDVNNPAAKIMNMQNQARLLMEKASFFL